VSHILVAAPQEYVNTYSTLRPANLKQNEFQQRSRGRGRELAFTQHCHLPILYGMHCNKGRSGGGDPVLRNSVGDEGGEWGAQTKGVSG